MRKKKMVKIENFNSIPASFVEIAPQTPDSLYTRGTLDVFYVGETADGRLFTKQFSDNLLKSIAYTPVVSHYDAEKDDFEGHAAQQEIYGLVDPMVPPTYVEHDGATWARCETILYTERPDQVGEIAKKIIGHAQSLELQPGTLKYKINRDAHGNFKNLEFLEGKFIGVSVLGEDQDPAFTGSGFFEKLKPEAFARGKEMTLTIQEFAKLSWGEKANYIANALYAKYGDNFWCIRDVYDNAVVYSVYDEESNSIRLYRCKYKLDGETATLTSEPEEVHPSYEKLSVEDPSTLASKKSLDADNEDIELQIEAEENKVAEPPVEPNPEPEPEPQPEPQPEPEPNADPEPAADPEPEPEPNADPEPEPEPEQSEGGNAEPENPGQATLAADSKGLDNEEEKPTATSTLSDSERIELEAYRKAKKIELINSYSADLSAEEVKELTEKVDALSFDELKIELDARFVANIRKKREEAPAATPAAASFKWYPSTSKTGNNELANYIGNLLHK
jgi:hypothetical protein